MSIRNRTNEFLKSRRPLSSDKHHLSRNRVDEVPLLISGQPTQSRNTIQRDIEEGIKQPTWLELKKDVEIQLKIISDQMVELAELHRKYLLPGFEDTTRQERQIEKLTAQITANFHTCQAKATRLGKEGGILPPQESQMRKNVQTSLAGQIQDLLSSFRKSQSDYLNTLTQRQQKTKDMFSYTVPTQDSLIMNDEPEESISELEGEEMQTLQPRKKDAARSREIQQLYRSIHELSDIVKDLSSMVIDQGTILDRIDYNLETANVATTGALVELRKANESHKSSRTKLCILLLCILIMILVVVIIIKGVL